MTATEKSKIKIEILSFSERTISLPCFYVILHFLFFWTGPLETNTGHGLNWKMCKMHLITLLNSFSLKIYILMVPVN